MNKKATLQVQAIQAAKDQNWEHAATLNQLIIDMDNRDIGAYNRLGVAFIQQKRKKEALSAFKQALNIDKSNSIAKKHFTSLTKNQSVSLPSFSADHFIEEPGKTKTVELHRLASKNILNKLRIGDACRLITKKRFISVEHDNDYIGALPEDLSFRLTKLIGKGNEYSCRVRSVDSCSCTIFLRETKRSKKNAYTNSFPLAKTTLSTVDDIDDAFLEDEVPVQIVSTDNDDQNDASSIVRSSLQKEENK